MFNQPQMPRSFFISFFDVVTRHQRESLGIVLETKLDRSGAYSYNKLQYQESLKQNKTLKGSGVHVIQSSWRRVKSTMMGTLSSPIDCLMLNDCTLYPSRPACWAPPYRKWTRYTIHHYSQSNHVTGTHFYQKVKIEGPTSWLPKYWEDSHELSLLWGFGTCFFYFYI